MERRGRWTWRIRGGRQSEKSARREGTRSIGRGGEDGEYEKGVQGLRGKGKNEKTRPREEKRRGGNRVRQEKNRQEGMKKRDVGRWTEKERSRERER